MNALVLAMVLGAAGSAEVEGAVTVAASLSRAPQAGGTWAEANGRVDLRRDFGRFFVEGRASFLVTGGMSGITFGDLGSRLTVGYRPAGLFQHLSLEVLPFTSTLRLPSFDWANRWGTLGLGPWSHAPVVTAEVATRTMTFWLSGRFKSVLNVISNTNEVIPEVFVGLDAVLPQGLRLELRAARLSWGISPSLGSVGVSLPVTGGGGGARLSWVWNEPVGAAVDLSTYGSDPLRFERLFTVEPRRSAFAAQLMLEGGGGGEQLANPEEFGKGRTQLMGWVDFQARLRVHQLRLFGTARLQSATHTVFDYPGLPPWTAFGRDLKVTPLVAGFLGADYTVRALRLTPGLLLRVTLPGSLSSFAVVSGGNNPPPGATPGRTEFLLPGGFFGVLPEGRTLSPLIGASASSRWEVVSFMSVIAALDVDVDLNNYLLLGILPSGSDQVRVKGSLLMQARF